MNGWLQLSDMLKEQNSINDGEGFVLNGKRVHFLDRYKHITFIYTDDYGLIADDDPDVTHWRIRNFAAQGLMSDYFPNNHPDNVHFFFDEVDTKENLDYYLSHSYEVSQDVWKDLFGGYIREKLKPSFDTIQQFKKFIIPILARYFDKDEELRYYGIDGRAFLLGDNTVVLTFWWQECNVSPDQVLKIISSLKEQYPQLKNSDFYIALARKVVPVEEFTGNFNASDEDRGQIEKQKEIHLANCREKHKALNPYLTDRSRHQGQKLQMANGDEMTQAEYNSYLRQESIKRMVKRVIVEYLNLKTKLVIR